MAMAVLYVLLNPSNNTSFVNVSFLMCRPESAISWHCVLLGRVVPSGSYTYWKPAPQTCSHRLAVRIQSMLPVHITSSTDLIYRRGNALIIAGTTLVLIAVTWGGIRFPWDSAHVLGPLITGAILLLIFLVYERTVPSEPTFPLDVLANRTSLAG